MNGLRRALRSLLNSTGFTGITALTLTVAIAACTIVFALLQVVVLRPLPFENPEALYAIKSVYPQRTEAAAYVTTLKFQALRNQRDLFADVAFSSEALSTWRHGNTDAEMAQVRWVSPNLLAVLGTSPTRGRGFTQNDINSNAATVMISDSLWRTRFASDPQIVGHSILVDESPREIVGVLPRGIRSLFGAVDLVMPKPDYGDPRKYMQLDATHLAIGRLAPNVTVAAADARLADLSARFRADYPTAQDAASTNILRPLQQDLMGESKRTLWILAAAVLAVLLIACANVANLFLARVSHAWRDFAVLLSLGAPRGAILQRFFAESLIVSIASGAFGALLAWLGVRGVVLLAADHLPRASEVEVGIPALLFCLGVSLLAAILVCLYPAWRAVRMDVQAGLRETGRGAAANATRGMFREGLVVAQVSLSLVLLACSGLLAFSVYRLLSADLGFETAQRAVGSVALPPARYATAASINDFYRRLETALDAAPELDSAGAIAGMPLSGSGTAMPIMVFGQRPPPPDQMMFASIRLATPGYFEVMGIQMREGRMFNAEDGPGRPPALIINETLAKAAFPNGSAVGQQLNLGGGAAAIVGVIRDVRTDIATATINELYIARDQVPLNFPGMTLVGRARPGIAADAVVPVLRRVLRAADPSLALHAPKTLAAYVGDTVQLRRLALTLLLVLSAVAVLLAAVGIYAVLAYTVAQRTAEIGVRMALGARRSHIITMVLSRGMTTVLAGLAFGLVGILFTTRLMGSMLYQVQPLDPRIIGAALLTFVVVAVIACLVPALRAARMDPLQALRTE